MLTVGSTAYTGKTVTFHNALESFTFRSTDNIAELYAFEDVSERYSIA